MFRKIIFLVFLIFIFFRISGQSAQITSDTLSLLFIGDIMGHDSQIRSAEDTLTGTYDYADVFRYINDEISGAGISIANLEVTLAGPPFKGYPQFSSPVEFAIACRDAGIDCLVTANNHSADRGKKGIINTINKLDSIGMRHTGTFQDKTARDTLYPLIIKKESTTIALLNYTYGINGKKSEEPVIVNMLDKDLIGSDILKAKSKNPDLIIIFLHWGTEYDTIPSQSQTDLADYLFSRGADLIVGSHPHVIQKMVMAKRNTIKRNRVLIYSLGNFVSNQRKPKTDGGAIVQINVLKTSDSIEIITTGYYLTWVYTPEENNRKKYYILPCSKYENRQEFFSNPGDYTQLKSFINDSRALLNNQNISVDEYIFSDNKWVLNR
jgi:poly-gamma-glutamate capsule biosynthesis protein CapA/YwtB (metallophosphatase superfamily)